MYKVLIMEKKIDYYIGMCEDGQMMRIKPKENIEVGHKIYVLEEDLFDNDPVNNKIPVWKKPLIQRTLFTFAALILCFLVWQQSLIPVYAMVSIDGDSSLQLKIDEDGTIKDATSVNDSYDEEQLNALIGQNIAIIDKNNASLIAAASLNDELSKEFKDYLRDIFGDDVVYAYGNTTDIESAQKNQLSLGVYLIEHAADTDTIEEVFEGSTLEQLQSLLKEKPHLSNNPIIQEVIEDKVEDQEEELKELEEQKQDFIEEALDIQQDELEKKEEIEQEKEEIKKEQIEDQEEQNEEVDDSFDSYKQDTIESKEK